MHCPQCQKELTGDERYCPACAAPLFSQEAAAEPPEITDVLDEIEPDVDEPTEQPLSKKLKKNLWAILALLLIAGSTLAILLVANVNLQTNHDATLFENDLLAVRVQQDERALWGYLDPEGNLAIAPAYDDVLPFADNGLAAVKQGELWGYINKKGETVISFAYQDAGSFSDNGLAAVKQGESWGYI